VSRLNAMLEQTFGAANPIVFNLPPRDSVTPDDVMLGDFTMFVAGATGPMSGAFAGGKEYWVERGRPTDPRTPNGFEAAHGDAGWMPFRPSAIATGGSSGRVATDSWPFLYLQRPMVPQLNLRGIAIMGTIGALLLVPFLTSRLKAASQSAGAAAFWPPVQMFLLGAGFMLIETKAVVHMALLFGGTWIVNAVVFCAVLVMILAANLFVLAVRPRSTRLFYLGLLISLATSALVPMDAFLGWERGVQVAGACALAFAPVFFAGVVFALSFEGARDADLAFGANIAGALFGGLSEYSSMLVGFQYVVLVALAFYAMSWVASRDRISSPVL